MVSPNFLCGILMTKVAVLGGGPLGGDAVGAEPHEWDECPYNRDPTGLPAAFSMQGHRGEASCEAGCGLSPAPILPEPPPGTSSLCSCEK